MHFFYASPPKLAMIPENIDKEGSLPSVCLHSVEAYGKVRIDYMETNISLENCDN